MDFKNLGFKTEVSLTTKVVKPTLDFNKDILKKPIKKSAKDTHLIEPGNKIPTGQFHNISQYCDTCECVQSHAHKPEKRKLICLICKTIKIY